MGGMISREGAFLLGNVLLVIMTATTLIGTIFPLVSTLVGSALDTALFFTIAFSASLIWLEPGNDVGWAGEILPLLGTGPEAPLWVSLAVADWFVKLSLALLALVPFRMITARLTAQIA